MSEEEEILGAFLLVNDYRILTNEELEDVKKAINNLQQENTILKQQLKDIEEYLESIKDMPDADMYIKLGENEEFKHILDLIHKGSE